MNCLLSSCCLKGLCAEWQKSETYLEKSKGFTQNVENAAKCVKRKNVQRSKKNIAGQAENQCQDAACEQKKTLARIKNSIQTKKLGLEWALNGLGKQLRKISDPKNEKTVKIRVKFPHVNKKNTTEKPNFCSNTVFSLYFKIRAKKIHSAKPLVFPLHFLFRHDQNHYSNSTSKIMKMSEQILIKKDSAPIPFKFFEL